MPSDRPVTPPAFALRALAGKSANLPYAAVLSRHAQMQAGFLLQVADDGEEIFRLRIAARAEHADQALGRRAGRFGELFPSEPPER